MEKYSVINKKVGETPLQALEIFRKKENIENNIPLTYAGRLDPMAEGKLLVLIGDECKKRAKYDGLDKEYEFEVLVGFKTDTGDVLGMVEADKIVKTFKDSKIKKVANSFRGKHSVPYPAFSSKKVDGKQLHQHANENGLDRIDIPNTNGHIYKIKLLGSRRVSIGNIVSDVISKINSFKPDATNNFRQPAILLKWQELNNITNRDCVILKFRCVVSSGTYMRTLSSLIAEKLGTHGLAYSIKRTKIGVYVPIFRSFGVWFKKF